MGNGKKLFNVNGYDHEPLGTLQFDYETINFASK